MGRREEEIDSKGGGYRSPMAEVTELFIKKGNLFIVVWGLSPVSMSLDIWWILS